MQTRPFLKARSLNLMAGTAALALLLWSAAQAHAGNSGLTPENLERNTWECFFEKDVSAFTLSFGKAGVVRFDPVDGLSADSHFRRYSFQKGVLQLGEEQHSEADVKKSTLGKHSLCRFAVVTDSLLYSEKLDCAPETMELFNKTKGVADGALRMVGATPVSVFNRKLKTTTALRVRSGPSTKDKPLKWIGEAPGGGRVDLTVLKKGESVHVLARTRAMAAVGKYRNYWYYVQFEGLHEAHPVFVTHRGWVFGEFVR